MKVFEKVLEKINFRIVHGKAMQFGFMPGSGQGKTDALVVKNQEEDICRKIKDFVEITLL